MKLHYYRETDILYIELSSNKGADSREFAPGIVLDFDEVGQLVGIDIRQASTMADLAHLQVEGLPILNGRPLPSDLPPTL